jgi:hypothetical protein
VRDRSSLVVGLIFAAVIVVAAINMLGDKDEGTLGLDRISGRWALPEFAVPRADGPLEGDAIAAITWFADTSVFRHFGLPRTLPNS